MADILGFEEESDLPLEAEETLQNMPPEEWYAPGHGVEYAKQLAEHIRQNPDSVADPKAVLFDLDALERVLRKAEEHGLRWHLDVDF